MKRDITPTSSFVWSLFKRLIIFPGTFVLFLFGMRKLEHIILPFSMLGEFLFQAKATISIIGVLILTFIISLFFPESLIKTLVSYPSDLVTFRWFSFVTSGFLHADLTHLFGNCLVLFIFGRSVERSVGSRKLIEIYVLSLIVSNVFASFINYFLLGNNIPGLGASGAIMGVVAAGMLLSPFSLTFEFIIPLPLMLIAWMYMFIDFTGMFANDGIGHFAHIGGFLAMTVFGLILLKKQDKKKLKKGLWVNIISFAVFLVVMQLFGFSPF